MDENEMIQELEKHNILETMYDKPDGSYLEKQYRVKEKIIVYWVYNKTKDMTWNFYEKDLAKAVKFYLTGELE